MDYLGKILQESRINQDDKIDYRAMLNKYLLSKWHFYIISIVVFASATNIFLDNAESRYLVKSKLLLMEEGKLNNGSDDWLKRNLNLGYASENVSNEIQILSSVSLMKKVVDDLALEIDYFQPRLLSQRTLYDESPIKLDYYQLSRNKAYKKPLTVKIINDQEYVLYSDDSIGKFNFNTTISCELGNFRFCLDERKLKEDNHTIQCQFNIPTATAQSYIKKLNIDLLDPNSSIVELSLEDSHPTRGIDILNKLIENYKQFSNRENDNIGKNTLQFIDARLAEVGRELSKTEYNLEQFKTNNSITAETTSDLPIILENANHLVENQQNYKLQSNILKYIQKDFNTAPSDNFELIPANVSSINSELSVLIERYNTMVLQRKHLLETAQASHPMVQNFTQNLAELRKTIRSTISNILNEIELKLEVIQKQYDDATKKLKSVPGKERQMVKIERDRSVIEELYVYMLQKREETALSLIATKSLLKVIDEPYSSSNPVAPNRTLIYLAGLFGGFGAPLSILLILSLFNNSVSSKEELIAIVPNHPVIGTINKAKLNGSQVVTAQNSRSLISERFRSLRTNLLFNNGNKQQCILVTSSISTEGKTFIAVNLATSYATTGMKTILLDFDMRNPKMSSYLKETNKEGLSNFLTGNKSLPQIIKRTSLDDNLHFIASGPIPPAPSELINREKLDELFEFLTKNYDVIIVDTAPVGLVSDAVLLANYITHSLFVVRAGLTKKEMIEEAQELFDEKKLTNPAMVLNAAKNIGAYSSYHYNGYYN